MPVSKGIRMSMLSLASPSVVPFQGHLQFGRAPLCPAPTATTSPPPPPPPARTHLQLIILSTGMRYFLLTADSTWVGQTWQRYFRALMFVRPSLQPLLRFCRSQDGNIRPSLRPTILPQVATPQHFHRASECGSLLARLQRCWQCLLTAWLGRWVGGAPPHPPTPPPPHSLSENEQP